MSTPIHYDTFDADWADEGTSFADYCAQDLAGLLPTEVLDKVAAKMQRIAPWLEAEWQRLEAEEQAEAQAESLRLEAVNKATFAALQAQALERVAVHKRATPFALVITQLNDTHTKRARTDAIAV
jgi:regulator of protease activity HflC (stomatin/prohibitin superfamily)